MATSVKCLHCGSYNTEKTTNEKLTNALATTGTCVGGAWKETCKY